jgi:hypothetical protein
MFIYPIYNHNWRNISNIYIRLASKEIFSPSNKIYREVGRAKDLSAQHPCIRAYFKIWLRILGHEEGRGVERRSQLVYPEEYIFVRLEFAKFNDFDVRHPVVRGIDNRN